MDFCGITDRRRSGSIGYTGSPMVPPVQVDSEASVYVETLEPICCKGIDTVTFVFVVFLFVYLTCSSFTFWRHEGSCGSSFTVVLNRCLTLL